MIITSICQLIVGLLDTILIIEVPQLPESIMEYIDYLISTLASGMTIVAQYTHYNYLITLVALALAIEGVYFGYRLVMWIIRKIPSLNVS